MRKETTRDKEKKEILKGRQGESNEKTPRDKKKRTSGFWKNKRKNKEAKKTLCKKENVEKVFWSGNSEELQKGSVKMSQHKSSKEKKSFLMKKKTGRRRKHKGIFRPFKKIKKWENFLNLEKKRETKEKQILKKENKKS